MTFRIYFWDAGNANGQFFIDDIIINGTTMPIELASFTGKALDRTVQLNWNTASELNNDYMEVQRSGTGRAFEAIGSVDGAGTTDLPQSYTFIDEAPLPGINYYRLKQVDFDGGFEYHQVIAVDVSTGASSDGHLGLRLAPNPAQNDLRLYWAAGKEDRRTTIELFDMLGRRMATYTPDNQLGVFDLPVLDLAAGLYIVRVAQDGRSESIRFRKD